MAELKVISRMQGKIWGVQSLQQLKHGSVADIKYFSTFAAIDSNLGLTNLQYNPTS